MIRGLYTSAWSMMANNKKMDVISNNLANVNTTGYKKDTVVFQSFPDVLALRIRDMQSKLNPSGEIGNMQLGSDVGEVYTYYNQNNLVSTDRALDLAFSDTSNSFFTIGVSEENGDIKEYYTRDGAFTLNNNGQLITQDGDFVMGDKGPITLTSEEFQVDTAGVVYEKGTPVAKLLIKTFEDTSSLRKEGSNLLQSTAEAQEIPFNGQVQQGYLEQSNVNVIREMVDMISVMRAYEANQKMIQAHDSTLEKAVNEVGAVR